MPSRASFCSDGPATDSPSILEESTQLPSCSTKTDEGEAKEEDSGIPALRLRISETIGGSQALSELLNEEKAGECSTNTEENAEGMPRTLSLKTIKSNLLENARRFTPKLKCDVNSIISLDDGDELLKNTDAGLNNFMNRFAKHSRKRKPKDQKTVCLR